jgi:hypothetical protein
MKETIRILTIHGYDPPMEVFTCDICGKFIDNVMEYRGSLKAEHVCPECFEKHLFGGLAMERPVKQAEE